MHGKKTLRYVWYINHGQAPFSNTMIANMSLKSIEGMICLFGAENFNAYIAVDSLLLIQLDAQAPFYVWSLCDSPPRSVAHSYTYFSILRPRVPVKLHAL